MKKVAICVCLFILISFSIPIIFTVKFKSIQEVMAIIEEQNISEENTDNSKSEYSNLPEIVNYNYKKYETVKVLHTATNEIEEMNIDDYLYGVVAAEMPADFGIEALKAQAIVARTYTIYKIIQNAGKHNKSDICDDSKCCQAWITKQARLDRWEENKEENWNKIVTAVEATKGKIVTYNGEPINAFFHSNSGGTTEAPINVWGGSGYPYLQAVATSGENEYAQYSSEVVLTKQEFIEKMKKNYSEFEMDFSNSECIKIIEYTEGGRIKNIKMGNIELSGVEARTIFGLKSANFSISIEGESVKFQVQGYGHGVGMSQTGADSLAKQGYTYEQIIKHFYTGVEITEFE